MNDITFARALPSMAAPAEDTPSLLALSMWIRALFVGASLFVLGALSVFDTTSHGAGMALLAIAGAALAAVSLARTRALMRIVAQP